MSEEEIKEYLKRTDKLLDKLSGEDKDTLEWLIFGYNQCAKMLYEKENIIKEVRESAKRELKIAEENIKNSEQWLDVEEEQEHAKRDIHTGKIVKRYMEMFLEILDKENK